MSGTREQILELGESLIRTKGYNAFSYQDISSALGVKNAAVHYYFPTKANLGTSIVKTNIQRFEEMVENMQSLGFDEPKQLDTFIKIYIKSHREHKVCLVGALSPAFDTLSDSTQKELNNLLDLISQWLIRILTSGKEKGVFTFKDSPENRANIVFSGLVASLQLSRVNTTIDYKSICQSIQEDLSA